ncbi:MULTISPECIES: M13 family metallopeptidase [Luteibacter]|uniref:M13 family metallopeptidase n=1 Tax=Luteibacter TaxID=242605 RepID=UPI00056A417D|nr:MULTISPECIES: M13 family metallopeptidase [unclassified Luteibacter]MDQ8048279.1 M13 family metallopeptidase [Luteibacter sp.]MDR6641805.1 putative endopeptidase [Luteibacter sp. 1214]
MATIHRILATAISCGLASSAALAADPSGIDLKGIDHAVQPGDDFDGYASGAWKKTAVIPADRASTGVFLEVFQKAEKRNAELIKAAGEGSPAAGSNQRLIADYYKAYMDEAAIEKAGLAPLQPALGAIDAIGDKAALSTALGAQLRADVDPINATNLDTGHLLGLFVAQGLEDPSKNMPYLLQGGLGMPNRDYYLKNDKDMVDARAKYAAYVEALLRQAGTPDAAGKAKAIVALETKIAQAQESIVDSEDIHKANNPWPRSAFASRAPGIDWDAYFKAAGLDDQPTFIVWQPATVTKFAALVASEPLDTWKAWLRFHTINENASGLLPKAYDDLAFGFYGKVLTGTPKQRDRWKRGVGRVNVDLGDAVGQIYVKRYFPASSRAEVEDMVKNILKAFDARVDTLEWMSPATRQKAKAKIATIKVGVGYPDTWRDYSKLEIRPDDALGNHQRATLAEYRHQVAKLHQPVDRAEWWMTPQTVNAVNLPLQNSLNFPAAILEAPFFDPKADPASNYGSIGAVIGHEISHSFDNTGAEFDAQGRLANWWTDADQKHFKDAGQRLVEQFNQYEPLPGLHINGQQTLGENIADLSGLTIAYAAYKESLGGKPAPVIDGLSGDQRFFLAFAQSWRTKTRDAALRAQVIGDGHAPGEFRAQTVRNLDPWYDAFQPKPGQKLYLDPKQRVKIW